MRFSQFERIDVGRDGNGRIVIDCTGSTTMPIERAQAWLITTQLRLQREIHAGAKSFTFGASLRFVVEELRQAESIADDLYMHANDVDMNEQVYATWKYDDERDPLAIYPKREK